MATAIADAEARGEITRLASEQSALRRVATLVARGASPNAVFDAVTNEIKALVGAEAVTLARYEGDELVVLASQADRTELTVGQRVPVQDPDGNVTAMVRKTGRPARRDGPPQGESAIATILKHSGIGSRVAVPVVVEDEIWGVLAATWSQETPPDDTAQRMADFARLLDTAIGNADSREQLIASRARVLAAGDDARRRVVRDLHDGAQQRLVTTIVALKLTRGRAVLAEDPEAEAAMEEALAFAEGALDDLRELSRGILPLGLMHGGLRAAVDALVSRLELPVDVDVSTDRLPQHLEASAYFIVAEALTNVVKHAQATRAAVTAFVEAGHVHVEIRDDGIGGADPRGFGLMGIADRAHALGGELDVRDGDGAGTIVTVWIPLATS